MGPSFYFFPKMKGTYELVIKSDLRFRMLFFMK